MHKIDLSAGMADLLSQQQSGTLSEGCYRGDDGLEYCFVCHQRRQKRQDIFGTVATVRVMCRCQIEQRKEREQKDRIHEAKARIVRLRKAGITDPAYLKHRFERDDAPESMPAKVARAYVANWPKMREGGHGLLFCGSVGTGKSFYACCIANALLDSGVPVLVTNTIKLIDKLHTLNFDEAKSGFML